MPASLPYLEEVIVTAKQDSLLKLEYFEAGFTTQETTYALGESPEQLFRTLPVLVKRGLCIEAIEGDINGEQNLEQ